MIEISFLLLHEQRGPSPSFITNGFPLHILPTILKESILRTSSHTFPFTLERPSPIHHPAIPSYSGYHHTRFDNQQGLVRRCWRNCCQRLRARRRRTQPPLRYPRWIGSMRFVIPFKPNSLLVFPVLDLCSCCASVPSIVCRSPINFFGWQDRSGVWTGLGALKFMEV